MPDPRLRCLCSFNHCKLYAGNERATNEGAIPTGALSASERIFGCSLPLPPGPSDDFEVGHGSLPSVERQIY